MNRKSSSGELTFGRHLPWQISREVSRCHLSYAAYTLTIRGELILLQCTPGATGSTLEGSPVPRRQPGVSRRMHSKDRATRAAICGCDFEESFLPPPSGFTPCATAESHGTVEEPEVGKESLGNPISPNFTENFYGAA